MGPRSVHLGRRLRGLGPPPRLTPERDQQVIDLHHADLTIDAGLATLGARRSRTKGPNIQSVIADAGILPVSAGTAWLAHPEHNDCEQFTDGFLGQPMNTITALAFVVVAVLILLRRRGHAPDRWIFAGLVAATGIGSVVQHGPHPWWQAYAHDLPLMGLIAFIAVDSLSDLQGRRRSHAWWLVPTLALWPAMAVLPPASQLTQVVAAAAAIGLALARAWRRPGTRSAIPGALILLGLGSTVGTLSRSGWPLCNPESLLQGHAAWHVLAALAMWWLAPVVGRHGRPATNSDPDATTASSEHHDRDAPASAR